MSECQPFHAPQCRLVDTLHISAYLIPLTHISHDRPLFQVFRSSVGYFHRLGPARNSVATVYWTACSRGSRRAVGLVNPLLCLLHLERIQQHSPASPAAVRLTASAPAATLDHFDNATIHVCGSVTPDKNSFSHSVQKKKKKMGAAPAFFHTLEVHVTHTSNAIQHKRNGG